MCVCARVCALCTNVAGSHTPGLLTLCHRPWVPASGGSSRSGLSRWGRGTVSIGHRRHLGSCCSPAGPILLAPSKDLKQWLGLGHPAPRSASSWALPRQAGAWVSWTNAHGCGSGCPHHHPLLQNLSMDPCQGLEHGQLRASPEGPGGLKRVKVGPNLGQKLRMAPLSWERQFLVKDRKLSLHPLLGPSLRGPKPLKRT